MTYSLNTLNADRAQAGPGALARLSQEALLILGAVLLAFWLLALLSYSPHDPAWSTSGSQSDVTNLGGRLGALLADVGYYLLGWSVWWCFFAGLRAWLAVLALRLRSGPSGAVSVGEPMVWWRGPAARRVAFALALIVLLLASGILEWSRLYRLEALLPGTSGGVLGLSLIHI